MQKLAENYICSALVLLSRRHPIKTRTVQSLCGEPTDDAVQVRRKVGRQGHRQDAADAVQEGAHGAAGAGQRDPEAEPAVRLHHRCLDLQMSRA